MRAEPRSGDLRILACQLAIPEMSAAGERDAHLQQSAEKVRHALSSHAPVDLVVLPELSSIDYSRRAFENLSALAEPLEGPSFECWRALARDFGTHVAFGFPRRAGDAVHISMAVVAPSGTLLGHYDKLHLAQYGASMEKDYFTIGQHLFVFEIRGVRIAPIICYDIRIPELPRTLVVKHGVDLILHSGAYYRDPSFYSWHQFAVSRAIENQVFMLSLNRAGACYGNSIFCPPWMDGEREPTLLAEHDEVFALLTLDPSEITQARERYSFLRDRLESYDLPVIGVSEAADEAQPSLRPRLVPSPLEREG